MILYFSGTGNSEYVAKKIAKAVNEPLFSIKESIMTKKKPQIDANETLVFVTPTYAWRIPRIVEEWILENTDIRGQKVYFIMTCGEENGNAGKYLRKLCNAKGLTYMGSTAIVMPENYIAMFAVPDQKEAIEIVQKAEPDIVKVAAAICAGKAIAEHKSGVVDKIKSSIVNVVFYPLCVKANKFYATDACVGCGKCAEVCLLKNIELKDKKPVWGKNCTHCMACICDCPAEAIEYGRASKGKPRYHCPK